MLVSLLVGISGTTRFAALHPNLTSIAALGGLLHRRDRALQGIVSLPIRCPYDRRWREWCRGPDD
jgi:hypothetical protein